MSDGTECEPIQLTYPHAGITVISINRPQARNAVDAATARKLYDAVLAYEADDTAQVAILNGKHGTFCAGFDLKTVQAGDQQPSEDSNVRVPSIDVQERSQGPMGPSRLHIKKPVIAAVSGYAVAGGLELSLLGDMRIVEEDAIFGVFCRRWGVPLIDGGTVRLRAIVGLGRALDMILTGRPVDAHEALSMGLANRVVSKGTALDEAIVLAKQLLRFPQLCLNVDRASTYYACYRAESLEDALRYEYTNGITATSEGVAGAGRFSKGAGRGGSFEKL